MAEIVPIQIGKNYLAGRAAAQAEQTEDLRNRLATEEYASRREDRRAANDLAQQKLTAEQQKQFATTMMQAAQYGLQQQQPKAFIEQNYPQLAQMAGPAWMQLDDNGVKAKLQEAIGIFGPMAGVGPPQPKGQGALYKYVDENGNPIYGDAATADGKRPYIYTPEEAGERRPAPPRGYRYTPDGESVEPIPGGPADPNSPNRATLQPKPPTEGDKRARVMFFSMKNAEKQLGNVLGDDTSDIGQAILGKVSAGKVLQSQSFKRYEAAGLRWAANLLYLKSGATATDAEIRSTWVQFFPQPGDGPDVKAQKDEARQQEMAAINDTYLFEKSNAPSSPSSPTPGAQRPNTGPVSLDDYLKSQGF